MSTFALSVAPPDGVAAEGANIYRRYGPDSPWAFLRRIDIGEIVEIDLTEGLLIEVAAAFLVQGAEQPEEMWAITSADTATKAGLETIDPVTDFSAAQDGPDIVAKWTASDHPYIDHYELSMGPSVSQRIVLATVPAPATSLRTGWWAPGDVTLFLVAVTLQGQRSASAGYPFDLTIVAEPMMVSQAAVDEHTGGWAGTSTQLETSSGDLRIAAIPAANAIATAANAIDWPMWGHFAGSGTYVTDWVDVGQVVEEKVEIEATFDDDTDVPAANDPTPPVVPQWEDGVALSPGHPSLWRHVDGTFALVSAYGVKVEVDTAQDATPTPDGYRIWIPGTIYTYRQIRLRITLSCPWAYATPKITSWTWRRLRKNLKDEGEVEITATGGTAITFVQPFTAAPKVTASVVGSNGWVAQPASITTTGCDLRAYNGGTEQSTATVHWHAMGV